MDCKQKGGKISWSILKKKTTKNPPAAKSKLPSLVAKTNLQT
jgi:hypothetical protein